MNSKTIAKRLRKEGWEQVRQKGSHIIFKHPDKSAIISVPYRTGDVSPGVLRQIQRTAGWR